MSEIRNDSKRPLKELPVVAIIIPLYNHEKYVARAIRSAVEQDYPAKFVVVIDNNSTDNSYNTVKDVLEKTEENNGVVSGEISNVKIFLIKNTTTSGPSPTRNCGIKFAWNNTHIFCMLDADDYYLQGKISKSVAKVIEYPELIGGVYTDAIIERENGLRIEEFREPFSIKRIEQECIVSNTAMITKLAFQKCGLYDETMRTAEDWMLYIKISEQMLIVHIPEHLHVYSVTGQNASDIVNKNVWQANWAKIGNYLRSRKIQQK